MYSRTSQLVLHMVHTRPNSTAWVVVFYFVPFCALGAEGWESVKCHCRSVFCCIAPSACPHSHCSSFEQCEEDETKVVERIIQSCECSLVASTRTCHNSSFLSLSFSSPQSSENTRKKRLSGFLTCTEDYAPQWVILFHPIACTSILSHKFVSYAADFIFVCAAFPRWGTCHIVLPSRISPVSFLACRNGSLRRCAAGKEVAGGLFVRGSCFCGGGEIQKLPYVCRFSRCQKTQSGLYQPVATCRSINPLRHVLGCNRRKNL